MADAGSPRGGRAAGTGFALEKVGRGLAAGDIDNDGDLDLLITNNGQTADLLRNDSARQHALVVRLISGQGNRDAIGARVRVTTGSRVQRHDVNAGSSYLSQHDLRVHFGLGAAAQADRIEVRWPSGHVETLSNITANQIVTIQQGAGITARVPFRRQN